MYCKYCGKPLSDVRDFAVFVGKIKRAAKLKIQ